MIFNPPYKVVIIDDDSEILSIMSLILNQKFPDNLQICPYTHFKTGFEFIKNNDTHVVFVDLNLLDEEGLTGIEKIKNLHKRCQVVAFSSDTKLTTMLACYSSGADYFLEKPINKEVLGEIVDKTLASFIYWKNLTSEASN